MSSTTTSIRQARLNAAFLAMHREAARGMRLFPLDRHYKPFIPLALRRLRSHMGLLWARKPYLRWRALSATYEQIAEAYERRYASIEKKGGDTEWFVDKWLLGLDNVGKYIPYTTAFAQEFPKAVQATKLWQLSTWLQEQCQGWPSGACDEHDYSYLIEVLQEELLRGENHQPDLLTKAIDWLTEQREQALSAMPRPARRPRKLEDIFLNSHSAAQHIGTMTTLLVEQGVVSASAPHHYCLGELQGKKAAIKGVFPTLYRVLLHNGLISSHSVEVWAPLFRSHFAVSFSDRYAYANLEIDDKKSSFYLEAARRLTSV